MSIDISEKSFCVGPYVEIRINSDGSLTYCHAADARRETQSFNLNTCSLDQYWSRGHVMDLRAQLEQGLDLPACYGCYQAESQGTVSFRHRRNLQAAIFPDKDLVPSVIESRIIARSKSPDWKPKFYHVSFSNVCNLACMMCKPKYSTRLGNYLQRAGLYESELSVLDWTQGSAWQDFCQHLLANDQIRCLHVMGGEPLLHARFGELLTTLIQHNHTDFVVSLVTNGTVYDSEIMDLLVAFREVIIEISIECLGPANDYIRYYSQKSSVLHNIQQYLQHQSANCHVVLRSVPQALSVMDYHNLLQFAIQHGLNIDSNVIDNPRFLAAWVLPKYLKDQITENLMHYCHDHDINTVDKITAIRSNTNDCSSVAINAAFVISQLNVPEPPDIEDLRRQLADFCTQFDSQRSLTLWQCAPEIAKWLELYGYYTSKNKS